MQFLQDEPATVHKTFEFGWRALSLGLITVILSIIVSLAIVQLVELILA